MTATSAPAAEQLRTERRVDPVGVDENHPWLSWKLSAPADVTYAGYQVQVSSDERFEQLLWDSGFQPEALAGVRYAGEALTSRQGAWWRVRAFADEATSGSWSKPAFFEMGLLVPSDWDGEWIGIADDSTGVPIHLRTELELPADARRGRLYVSTLGWMRVFVDGVDVTEGTLVPRFTPYDVEVEYVTFALDALSTGGHTIEVVVADGRFRGALGIHGVREVYGDRLGALVQAEFDLDDGSRRSFVSGVDWTGGHGARSFADPKDGETIDFTRNPGGSESQIIAPSTVVTLPPHPRATVAEQTDPMRTVSTLAARTIRSMPGGSVIVDFGQNIAGVVRLHVAEPAGTRVVLQHAEDVTADGQLEWKHLDREGAKRKDRPQRFQRDEIIADGTSRWVQPWFTYHGFRYVEITGLTKVLEPEDIEAIVLSSVEVDPAGFNSSDDRLNRLYGNAMWSMVGNFLDTPTDCPQRERGGFTGDAQIFAPTATALTDVTTFFTRYLRSLRIDQLDDGRVPMIVPREYSPFSGDPKGMTVKASGSVGWGDAAVLLPWTIYQATGDVNVLHDQFDSMVSWVNYLRGGGARKGFIWGEWIRAGESSMLGAMRDNSVNRKNIGLAYFAHSASLVATIASITGRDAEAEEFRWVAAEARDAWHKAAVRRGGARIGSDRQDDYVRALAFDLLSADERLSAAVRLAELISKSGHIGTGFLSTALLLPVLENSGRRDLALALLLQESAPSWLNQVNEGATTVWENWVEPGTKGVRVGSSNHYSFGSVVAWLLTGIVGLAAETVGRTHVRFTPQPEGGLMHASGELHTDFGSVRAGWSLEGHDLVARIDIPVGVRATVTIGDTKRELKHGSHELRALYRTGEEGDPVRAA